MTLNEYLMYEGKHRELENGYTSRISVAPKRNRILVYLYSDEEDEEYCSLPPLLPCTNEFASICELVKENIDANTAWELEEVQVEDIEMDEDYDIEHSNTKEELQ
uniref:Uncharacterized protein n=1 Tax=Tanacetum cinerariifolium TaxID=118510 RepID=A0A6L2LUE7_TANCI|nr:hypothetical protein [Tanacetum cinerariifolium]